MLEDRDERVCVPSAHKIEIDSWDQLRHYIRAPVPPEHVTFELRQSGGAEPQAPEVPCRMKKIEVGPKCGQRNGSRHPITCFEQRPVERLAVDRKSTRLNSSHLGISY